MAVYMPRDTSEVLEVGAKHCESRSLWMDRFGDPAARDGGSNQDRRCWFERLIALRALDHQLRSWRHWLQGDRTEAALIAGHLRSRLMVNMAGGVMENAGLCIDRFGMPFIPGSAVKGCVRRMALAALRQWTQHGSKPVEPADPCAGACEGFGSPVDMLASIALVFGWGDVEWSDRKNETGMASDFAWAMSADEKWDGIRSEAAGLLLDRLGGNNPQPAGKPWKDLPAFAGSVAFLSAHPVDVTISDLTPPKPPPGKLEMDVLTPHHPSYYRGEQSVALDNEGPQPVLFPAVPEGQVFLFAVLPFAHSSDGLRQAACLWLKGGLASFGIGAKTNAGYGWFDVSDQLQKAVRKALDDARDREVREKQKRKEDEEKKRKEQERRKEREREKERLKSMTPEEREDYELGQMKPDKLNQHIQHFERLSGAERDAVYRLLKARKPDLWHELRKKAEKGKKKEQRRWAPVVQSVFKMAKERKEKMP